MGIHTVQQQPVDRDPRGMSRSEEYKYTSNRVGFESHSRSARQRTARSWEASRRHVVPFSTVEALETGSVDVKGSEELTSMAWLDRYFPNCHLRPQSRTPSSPRLPGWHCCFVIMADIVLMREGGTDASEPPPGPEPMIT